MIKAYINAWKKCLQWHGRTGVKDYWMYWITNILIILGSYFLFGVLEIISDSKFGIFIFQLLFIWAYALLQILPSVAITIRRLHDTNKPGWYYLINLVPIIGNLWFLIIVCTKGTYGDNDFGPDPKNTVYYTPDTENPES